MILAVTGDTLLVFSKLHIANIVIRGVSVVSSMVNTLAQCAARNNTNVHIFKLVQYPPVIIQAT